LVARFVFGFNLHSTIGFPEVFSSFSPVHDFYKFWFFIGFGPRPVSSHPGYGVYLFLIIILFSEYIIFQRMV